jgi:hypothetical protein
MLKSVEVFLDAYGRDLMLCAGLVLVAIGLWPLSHEAAIGLPGAVLTGVAIFGVRS